MPTRKKVDDESPAGDSSAPVEPLELGDPPAAAPTSSSVLDELEGVDLGQLAAWAESVQRRGAVEAATDDEGNVLVTYSIERGFAVNLPFVVTMLPADEVAEGESPLVHNVDPGQTVRVTADDALQLLEQPDIWALADRKDDA